MVAPRVLVQHRLAGMNNRGISLSLPIALQFLVRGATVSLGYLPAITPLILKLVTALAVRKTGLPLGSIIGSILMLS